MGGLFSLCGGKDDGGDRGPTVEFPLPDRGSVTLMASDFGRKAADAELPAEVLRDFTRNYMGSEALSFSTEEIAARNAIGIEGVSHAIKAQINTGDVGSATQQLALGAFEEKLGQLTASFGMPLTQEIRDRVVENITINPMMKLMIDNGAVPATYQPRFIVAVGPDGAGAGVRVITFAFVGTPVFGDRPDQKFTKCRLKMVTEDLVTASGAQTGIFYTCTGTKAKTMRDELLWQAEELRSALQGNWDQFVGADAGAFHRGEL